MGETYSKSHRSEQQQQQPRRHFRSAKQQQKRTARVMISRKRTATVPIVTDTPIILKSGRSTLHTHHHMNPTTSTSPSTTAATLIAPAIPDEYPSISSITPRPIGRPMWGIEGLPQRPSMMKKARSLEIPPMCSKKKQRRSPTIRDRLSALRLGGSHDLAVEIYADDTSQQQKRRKKMYSPLPDTFGKLSDSCMTSSGAESDSAMTATSEEEESDYYDDTSDDILFCGESREDKYMRKKKKKTKKDLRRGRGGMKQLKMDEIKEEEDDDEEGYGIIKAPSPRGKAYKKVKLKRSKKPPLLPKLSESKSEHSYVRRRSRTSLRRSGSLGKSDASSALTKLRRRHFGASKMADKLISIASPPISHDESDISDDESAVSVHSKQSASELARSLSLTPKTESRICSSIEVMYSFWMENVRPLMEAEADQTDGSLINIEKEKEYHRLCLLIYTNMFKRLPSVRKLFLSRDITITAKQVMGMLGWLVLCLGKQDAMKLIPRLKELGLIHRTRGVKSDYYQVMLDAIHESFTEIFEENYTLRVRFSLSQLFTVASDVMCERDFTSKASALRDSKLHVMNYITNLDQCLMHKEGKLLLEKFMQQHFCHELWLFMEQVKRYQLLIGDDDENAFLRREMAERIFDEFIDDGSPMQVNLSHGCRTLMNDLSTRIRLVDDEDGVAGSTYRVYTPRLFDSALCEAKLLTKSSVWTNFQSTIVKLAGIQKEFSDWQNEQIELQKSRESALKRSSTMTTKDKSDDRSSSKSRFAHTYSTSIDISTGPAPKSMKDLFARMARASDI